jgi:hypothetical protein
MEFGYNAGSAAATSLGTGCDSTRDPFPAERASELEQRRRPDRTSTDGQKRRESRIAPGKQAWSGRRHRQLPVLRCSNEIRARTGANEGGREQRPDARGIARVGLSAAGYRGWASLRPVLHWIAVSLSNVKRTAARSHCEGRSGSVNATRRPCSRDWLRRVSVLCVACRRAGAALPGHRNRLTPRPCRSDPDRSPVCPHPGIGSTGWSRCSTASSALRRTRGCADVHRALIPRGSPILARVFRRPAPRRRTGAASCLQLLRGR